MRPTARFPTLAAISLAGLCLAAPAHAERVLSVEEFEQMVVGRTLHFDRYGERFGAEQYFEDMRVIWAFEDGHCQRGIRFANAEGEICFVYEDDPAPQCWSFIEAPDGRFHAHLPGEPSSEDLVTRNVGREPLDCPPVGPGV